jgi:hypothetical protein
MNTPDTGGLTLALPQQLLDQLAALLAEALAPRLAAQLAESSPPEAGQPPLRRLLTLDQLVEQLPPGKQPATWKRWLYQRTRSGQVPGCVKIGGRLYFDHEQTIAWLTGKTVDLSGQQSLHQEPMPDRTHTGSRRAG